MSPSRPLLPRLAAMLLLLGVLGLVTALPVAAQTGGPRYDNCEQAIAAGRHDILRTDPVWNANLEHSADGIACKLPPRPSPVAATAPAPLPPAGPPIAQSTLTGAVVLIVVVAVVAVFVSRRERDES